MRTGLLLVVLLALPLAQAAGDAVRADLREMPSLLVEGPATLRAGEGALDLGPALAHGEAVSLSFQRATGRLVTFHQQGVRDVWQQTPEYEVRELSFGPGRLADVTCAEACAALVIVGSGGVLGLEGQADGLLRLSESDARYCSYFCNTQGPNDFQHVVPAGSLVGSLADARPTLEGRAQVFLYRATAVVANETLDLRSESRPHPTLGAAGGFERNERHLVLDLEGVRLDAPRGSRAVLMAGSWTMDVQGALRSPSATGTVEFQGRARQLDHDLVEIEGDLRLGVDTRSPLLGGAQVASLVEGRATHVRVGDVTTQATAGTGAPAVVATVTLAGLVLAAGAWLARGALLPFYSRLAPSRILAHPNRAQIHDLLQATPGLTTSDLSRSTGLARVVVQHHIRMLEAHRLVARREDGRARRFFVPEAAPGRDEMLIEAALRDDSRRRVAETLLAHQGATQRQLADLTGLSQRLVSYHLGRLESAGLVEGDAATPRRYRPALRLAPALAEWSAAAVASVRP